MKNEEKRRKMKSVQFAVVGMIMAALICFSKAKVLYAAYNNPATTTADMAQFNGVTVSPTGEAWMTDYNDQTNWRGITGYTIPTGVASSLRDLLPGEHYYSSKVTDTIKVGKWVVSWENSQCIHDTKWGQDTFRGFPCLDYDCMRAYNSGWFAHCADCNEPIIVNVYATPNTVKNITSIAADSWYVYTCPYCQGIEQTSPMSHNCKKISNNRYSINYNKNAPADTTVNGFMAPTTHMYNNASLYNGVMTEKLGYNNTRLRVNTYEAEGYLFKGWKTSKTGTYAEFTDGQEILNLTDQEKGVVVLYAHWERTESTLKIDANGGKYDGMDGITSITKEYGENYELVPSKVTPPIGYLVTFDANGGNSVGSITTTKRFYEWQKGTDFQGKLNGNTYIFTGENLHIDNIKAMYVDDPFILPSATKSGYSFAGWYQDQELTEFIGIAGSTYTTNENITLYAKWAELVLKATDDYQVYNGTGAVDLSWTKLGLPAKYYKAYQSTDKKAWTLIHGAEIITDEISIQKTFNKSSANSYTIEHTGYYELSAVGAKGANYGSYAGGKGGKTNAIYWLKKGDIITFYSGTMGSSTSGGTNGSAGHGGSSTTASGAGGGAATEVYITRDGTKVLLMAAAGGGGANAYATGGNGGGSLSAVGSMAGGSSSHGGGGGGAIGGGGGVHIQHFHQGDSVNGGGCYTKYNTTKLCGSAEQIHGPYWECSCGDTWGTESHGYFSSLPEHAGHEQYYMDPYFECSGCHTQLSENEVHYIPSTSVKLTCEYYDKPSGYIISANPSGGGSNYINTGYGCMNPSSSAGTNNGDGNGSLVSGLIGYHENNAIDNVKATDLADPNKVELSQDDNVKMYGNDSVVISWETPDDNGTTYYHQVESYKD